MDSKNPLKTYNIDNIKTKGILRLLKVPLPCVIQHAITSSQLSCHMYKHSTVHKTQWCTLGSHGLNLSLDKYVFHIGHSD